METKDIIRRLEDIKTDIIDGLTADALTGISFLIEDLMLEPDLDNNLDNNLISELLNIIKPEGIDLCLIPKKGR